MQLLFIVYQAKIIKSHYIEMQLHISTQQDPQFEVFMSVARRMVTHQSLILMVNASAKPLTLCGHNRNRDACLSKHH